MRIKVYAERSTVISSGWRPSLIPSPRFSSRPDAEPRSSSPALAGKLIAEFAYADTPQFAEARAIAAFARDLFLKREVDEVRIIATRFVNTLTQNALCLEFLPVGEIKAMKIPGVRSEEELAADTTESLFEPNPEFVLSYLLSHYLDICIYQVLLNAKASEQSARMVSMKNATENAEGLIKDLTLEYNKLRQGNITKELLEIAGGQSE